jgi:hypothetical protein
VLCCTLCAVAPTAGDVTVYEEEIQRLKTELDQARQDIVQRANELQQQVCRVKAYGCEHLMAGAVDLSLRLNVSGEASPND